MGGNGKIEVYQRTDGKWAWRLKAGNGQIIATDGGQGYENQADAEAMAWQVVNGDRSETDVVPFDRPQPHPVEDCI